MIYIVNRMFCLLQRSTQIFLSMQITTLASLNPVICACSRPGKPRLYLIEITTNNNNSLLIWYNHQHPKPVLPHLSGAITLPTLHECIHGERRASQCRDDRQWFNVTTIIFYKLYMKVGFIASHRASYNAHWFETRKFPSCALRAFYSKDTNVSLADRRYVDANEVSKCS